MVYNIFIKKGRITIMSYELVGMINTGIITVICLFAMYYSWKLYVVSKDIKRRELIIARLTHSKCEVCGGHVTIDNCGQVVLISNKPYVRHICQDCIDRGCLFYPKSCKSADEIDYVVVSRDGETK
jgi:hypothetical protein